LVLLVVLFIEQVLARKEKQALRKKLNMVIGGFFSEVGLNLLNRFNVFVENSNDLAEQLKVTNKSNGSQGEPDHIRSASF